MNVSATSDALSETSILPELSFDDLLDVSPAKKEGSNSSYHSDELFGAIDDTDRYSRSDTTLNTPGPKKPLASSTVPKRLTIPIPKPTIAKVTAEKSQQQSQHHVLLNSKNTLPKTSTTTFANQIIKITSKQGSASNAIVKPQTTCTVTTATATPTTIAGKTVVKMASGQILYIQKASGALRLPTSASGTVSATTTTRTATTSANTTATTVSGKTVVIRSADGKTMPLKAAPMGNVGGAAARSSPKATSTATSQQTTATNTGKKLMTGTAGQTVVLKTPLKAIVANATSNAVTATQTTPTSSLVRNVKLQKITTTGSSQSSGVVSTSTAAAGSTATSGGKIVVQSANGKQIVVSNQHLFKLSPKPNATPTASSGEKTATVSSGSSGSSIQLLGKSGGMQVVRVLPGSKLAAATNVTANTSSSSASVAAKGTTSEFKVLNTSLPSKFTMVSANNSTKIVTTGSGTHLAKKDSGTLPVTYTPVTSKVQKAIVTVPKLVSTADDDKNEKTTNGQPKSDSSPTTSSSVSLVRKRNITDLNVQMQRAIGADDSNDPAAQPKKTLITGSSVCISGRRILFMSNSAGGTRPASAGAAGGQQVTRIIGAQGAVNNKSTATTAATAQRSSANNQATSSGKEQGAGHSPTSSTSSGLSGHITAAGNMPKTSSNTVKDSQQKGSSTKAAEMKALAICNQAQAMLELKQQQSKSLLLKRTYSIQQQQKQLQNQGVGKAPSLLGKDDVEEASKPLLDEGGAVRRKHCNCSKSQCLKLYCDCFANGEFCQDCTCKDCFNNLQYEDERQQAIRNCLERNPSAFKPKITTRDQGDMRLHNKGCNCKRSGCLKNYCECYEAKIPCSSNCKCVGCRNFEYPPDFDVDPPSESKMESVLLAPGSKRSYEQMSTSIKNEKAKALASELYGSNSNGSSASDDGSNATGGKMATTAGTSTEKQQCNLITPEVIDATIQCMISQADECLKNSLSEYQTEKMIMEELGRCLVEIIDFSIRNTDASYTQE